LSAALRTGRPRGQKTRETVARSATLPHLGGTRSARPVTVPDWAKDAVWYQIFPERFRNGSPKSDPVLADIHDGPVNGWATCPWGMDWYRREPWEESLGDFDRSIYLRRFGGDLVGVREKLGYLQDLGINAIYLNPVFMAPSLHKYDAACLHHVDPTFGPDRAGDMARLARVDETEDPATWIWTAADRCLLDLVADAHRRGIRVILDGVFNHVGTRFFAFRDVLKNGRRSRYARWFRIDWWNADGTFEYRGWFGHKGLPELARTADDLAAPVRDYLFAVTRRWMDPDGDGDPSDGVDGWRLDVAFCVPHGFWKKWRRLVKGINPDAFLTGEIVEVAREFLRGDEFDSVMNYMWLFPAARFFAPGPQAIGAREFRKHLDVLRRAYSPEIQLVLQNLLDSHDVGRIATVLENRLPLKSEWQSYFDLTRIAANPALNTRRPGADAFQALRQLTVFQMTYPGAPMIYYGTEVGLWGANDPDNRQLMLWDDIAYEKETHVPGGRCAAAARRPDRKLLVFFRKAIALRREHAVFRRGRFEWVKTGSDRLLAFRRWDDQQDVTALFNAGDQPLTYRLAHPSTDLWESGKTVRAGPIRIAPRGWRILSAEQC
jgi:cyclomaltodextrinase / maltogenic alpha-amylase / neopullulanase